MAVHLGLLARCFTSEKQMRAYLDNIDRKYQHKELLSLLDCLYCGHGRLLHDELADYGVCLPETLNRRWLLNQLLQGEPNQSNMLALAHTANEKTTDIVVQLKAGDF